MEYTLIPVNLDDFDVKALDSAVTSFNDSQDIFKLKKVNPIDFGTRYDGKIDWSQLNIYLTNKYTGNHLIAVTSSRFNDNWFSHTERFISAITTADWRDTFSPPGPHCYLLIEFAVVCYLSSSNMNEANAQAHVKSQGCMIDFCGNKKDIIWKLRAGYICEEHKSLFKKYSGNENSLTSIIKILNEARRITLSLEENVKIEINNSDSKPKPEFTMEYLKKYPQQ